MSWDIVARALFVDNGAAAGLAKFNAGIKEIEKVSPGGARGITAIERGLSSLAAEAVGVQGPIGRVAEGLLRFGGGSGLVLGVVAGVGLIAGAYKLAAAESEKLAASHDKLAASYDQLLAKSKPVVLAVIAARQAVVDAQNEVERLSTPSPEGTVKGTPGEIARAQENVNTAVRNFNALRSNEIAAGLDAINKPLKELGDELARINVEIIQFGATLPNILQEIPIPSLKDILQGPGFFKTFTGLDEGRLNAASFFSAGVGKSAVKGDIEAARSRTGPGLNAEAIAASSVALIGALKQGGLGGTLTAGGGLLTAAGFGVPGIVTTALGGVFSLFDNSEERRHKEMMRELKKIAEKPIPQAVVTQPIFVGAGRGDVAQLEYEAQRRTDRDAVNRGVGGS